MGKRNKQNNGNLGQTRVYERVDEDASEQPALHQNRTFLAGRREGGAIQAPKSFRVRITASGLWTLRGPCHPKWGTGGIGESGP